MFSAPLECERTHHDVFCVARKVSEEGRDTQRFISTVLPVSVVIGYAFRVREGSSAWLPAIHEVAYVNPTGRLVLRNWCLGEGWAEVDGGC